MVALVPQLRLRYPVFGDRLVPYVVGGIGLRLTEFNDRKPPGFGHSVRDKESSALVGTLGRGLEYYVADNMAVGAEVKYVLAGNTEIAINGVSRRGLASELPPPRAAGWSTSSRIPSPSPSMRGTRHPAGIRFDSMATNATRTPMRSSWR